MRRNLEKSLQEFDELTKGKTSRKGIIRANELQELLFLALKESDKWGGKLQLMDLIYTPWKAGYVAGYKCAKNERRKAKQRLATR